MSISQGTIDALVAVFVGFALSTFTSIATSFFKNRQQAASIRTIISTEVDYNLELLHKLLNKPQTVLTQFGKLPTWKHEAWLSQIPIVATALKSSEIQALYRFHHDLEHLKELPDLLYTQGTDGVAIHLDSELEEKVKQLITEGNPLKYKHTKHHNTNQPLSLP